MSRGALPLAAYAALLAVLAAVMWVWSDYTLPGILLTAGAAAMAVIAGAWVLGSRRIERLAQASEVRAVPDLSAATALAGFAIPTMLVGLYLGPYLVLIGGGLLVLAVGGLVREAVAARRALASARDGAEERAP
jgi:ABC-type glycerol-3-phosphate transport system permease component